jgi:Ca2+-binding EF-hand superfamily protein
MALMKERRMSGEELFRMIDVDKNNVCSLSELEEVLKTLEDDKTEFNKKEIKSIHDFFDINNDGEVSEQEFLS